jgi:adenylate cyclase
MAFGGAVVRSKRLVQFAIAALASLALLFLRASDPQIMASLRASGFDTLQQFFPRKLEQPQFVRIVDIDETSLKKLGQWPWSRQVLAQLVDRLGEYGAAVVAFDIVFPESDRLSPKRILNEASVASVLPPGLDTSTLPDSDTEFAAAISRNRIVLAYASGGGAAQDEDRLVIKSGFAQTGADASSAPPLLGQLTTNLPTLDAVAAGVGGMNIDLAGEQGVARQIPMLWTNGTRFAPSLSMETLRVAQGAETILINADPDNEGAIESIQVGEIEIPTAENSTFFVHYRPDPRELYVSAADVLDPTKAEKLRPLFDGHIVYVGTSAVGLLDIRTSALGESIPGVSIHAQATEQMLSGHFLTRPQGIVALEFIAVILGGLAIAAAGAFFRPLTAFAVPLALSALFALAVVLLFNGKGLLLDATFPIIAFILTYLASTAWRLAVTDKDGRNMRRMFGHYVAPAVLNEIESNPQALKLGGEVRDVTVMFVDIANFTPLSEKLSPEELVNTVNGLWNACTSAILSEQGTIDKFIGDAIMAFWNAPVEIKNHQYRAAKAALGIRKAVAVYNENPALKSLLDNKSLQPLAVRIGLASGPACVGNMGSADRFDYSVLGDTVNIAARTESSGKRANHDILIAGRIDDATDQLALLNAGTAPMKGKSGLEQIHALIGDEQERQSKDFASLAKEHDHLSAKLAAKPSARNLASIRQLLDEVALHHPTSASYLRAMADRPEDFVNPSPARG